MVRQRSDLFGKNLAQCVIDLRGTALVEVEIPPTDAMRIDLWFVPDSEKQREAPEFMGALAAITAVAAAIELWSDTVDKREFRDSYYKCHAWLRALEMRDKRVWAVPWLWHICAGKPVSVIEGFGFERIEGLAGCYTTTKPDWQVSIVVISELPKTRDTLLLRLLGHSPVRQQAIRELDALPDDAWEKELARGWVKRLQFDVPDPASLQSGSQEEFVMNILTWYAEEKKKEKAEYRQELEPQIKRELEPQIKRELEPQIKRELEEKLMGERAHLFERRLGRALSVSERETLANRVRELGAERVMDIALDSSPGDLAAWLEA